MRTKIILVNENLKLSCYSIHMDVWCLIKKARAFIMAKKKYYAVKVGKKPGIYLTWDECKLQIEGYRVKNIKGFKL